jgi:hypothetical protein
MDSNMFDPAVHKYEREAKGCVPMEGVHVG